MNKQLNVHDLISSRYSSRAYNSDRRVEPDVIAALLEAARWAPSCFNEQPWRFLVTDRFTQHDDWHILLSCLADKNQAWAANAPILILTAASDVFEHNGQHNRWAEYDTGAAVLSLVLQATALGLITRQMGGFDARKVARLFNLPTTTKPMSVVAVGHALSADEQKGLAEALQTPARMRKPVSDLLIEFR